MVAWKNADNNVANSLQHLEDGIITISKNKAYNITLLLKINRVVSIIIYSGIISSFQKVKLKIKD